MYIWQLKSTSPILILVWRYIVSILSSLTILKWPSLPISFISGVNFICILVLKNFGWKLHIILEIAELKVSSICMNWGFLDQKIEMLAAYLQNPLSWHRKTTLPYFDHQYAVYMLDLSSMQIFQCTSSLCYHWQLILFHSAP